MIPENWAEKPSLFPPPPGWGKIFMTSDLSISGNFEQLWFLWQKCSPPAPQDEGNFFDFRSIHFRQFQATLVFVAEKPPPPPTGWEETFWLQIYPFQVISSNFGLFVAEKPPPPRMRENFLTSDLSIPGNFEQLWFMWQKSPPSPGWGKIFWLQFFGFCGLHHTGRIPMAPILQIHTQISPIWISSIGYQLCQLFKILTYTELQDSGSWCIWKAYRQPYHNTH